MDNLYMSIKFGYFYFEQDNHVLVVGIKHKVHEAMTTCVIQEEKNHRHQKRKCVTQKKIHTSMEDHQGLNLLRYRSIIRNRYIFCCYPVQK